MNQREVLFHFEEKIGFLYELQANGVPIYAGLRDNVVRILTNGQLNSSTVDLTKKDRIFPARILHSIWKWGRLRKAQTLIFTSAVFRRDYGRNLAAEFLMEKYPDAAVFEWPARVEAYDKAYFQDKYREKYCPMELYLIFYKLYHRLNKKRYQILVDQAAKMLETKLQTITEPLTDSEQDVLQYLKEVLPKSYAETMLSQDVFKYLFRNYKQLKYAVDFWGSGRENIIPVLPGNPDSIELQHGIITELHQGYMYSSNIQYKCEGFFGRKLLVYGQATRKMLTEKSIFKENQIEVIGNPRILKYKQVFGTTEECRKLVLFTSQPFEQDGAAIGYYAAVIPKLEEILHIMRSDKRWQGYSLAVKLHPRETAAVAQLYQERLPECTILGNASPLYELLLKSMLHITATSTVLYEAAIFDVPTITLEYNNFSVTDIYGFDTWKIEDKESVCCVMDKIIDEEQRKRYLKYLKNNTTQYM